MIIVFFLMAYRNPKLVPTKGQWIAESVYGFARNNIAGDIIGHEGIRSRPTSRRCSASSCDEPLGHRAVRPDLAERAHRLPGVLAVITYVIYICVGIRKHGFGKYMKLI